MNRIIILLSLVICLINNLPLAANTSHEEKIRTLERMCSVLQEKQTRNENSIRLLSNSLKDNEQRIQELSDENVKNRMLIDSLQKVCIVIETTQSLDRKNINVKIDSTDNNIRINQDILKSRTLWGGIMVCMIVITFIIVAYLLYKRIVSGTSTIDDVRKAQEALQTAQKKLQEDSLKFDNQILTLVEKQMNAVPAVSSQADMDHSLALKVADEIVRIELNLSRMDSTVKGYKQLSKAVERIRNNFQANGYEIVDMLGKPYNEGMKVVANFVPDETLQEGEQRITGITKPQINYNGQMIQSAQITVSQNI